MTLHDRRPAGTRGRRRARVNALDGRHGSASAVRGEGGGGGSVTVRRRRPPVLGERVPRAAPMACGWGGVQRVPTLLRADTSRRCGGAGTATFVVTQESGLCGAAVGCLAARSPTTTPAPLFRHRRGVLLDGRRVGHQPDRRLPPACCCCCCGCGGGRPDDVSRGVDNTAAGRDGLSAGRGWTCGHLLATPASAAFGCPAAAVPQRHGQANTLPVYAVTGDRLSARAGQRTVSGR